MGFIAYAFRGAFRNLQEGPSSCRATYFAKMSLSRWTLLPGWSFPSVVTSRVWGMSATLKEVLSA